MDLDNKKQDDIPFTEQYKEAPVGRPGPVPKAAWFIIVCELCERFSFYGASLLFVPYLLDRLGQSKSSATAINSAFLFFAYFTTIVGAILADTYWGKFKTILFFSVAYLLGLILLSVSSIPASIDSGFGLTGFCLATFLFIAWGTGGIKSNVSAFAAEQVPQNSAYDYNLTVERVFRFFYWAINAGAFFGMLICPILVNNLNSPPGGFGLPAAVFFVGIFLFIFGRKFYVEYEVKENPILKALKCIKYALSHRSHSNEHWLDGAYTNPKYDVEYVDGLKRTIKGCKVFLFYILYWALYNNMSSAFIIQGVNMSRPSWLGAEQLNLVNSLVLIIFLPVFDYWVFPFLRSKGFKLGLITRITIGFAICTIAFIYVTVLQHVLYNTGPYYDFSNVVIKEGEPYPTNNLSIWWQIPAYFLIAISEIFASATGLEYAFKYASPELKSVVLALFLLTNCGGSLIILILSIWSYDPLYTILFASQTAAMGVFTVIFYFLFRKQDD
ncbi:PTR2-domain-containing protein [Neoconidiobolus thromboides FSU 785]|nr:PTR2-domain-containing protein [Neoconidiobolus thromboides FSU 785]